MANGGRMCCAWACFNRDGSKRETDEKNNVIRLHKFPKDVTL